MYVVVLEDTSRQLRFITTFGVCTRNGLMFNLEKMSDKYCFLSTENPQMSMLVDQWVSAIVHTLRSNAVLEG